MLCWRRISAIGTPASPCFKISTIWLSVNRDFRMGISLAPESLRSKCLPKGEAYSMASLTVPPSNGLTAAPVCPENFPVPRGAVRWDRSPPAARYESERSQLSHPSGGDRPPVGFIAVTYSARLGHRPPKEPPSQPREPPQPGERDVGQGFFSPEV